MQSYRYGRRKQGAADITGRYIFRREWSAPFDHLLPIEGGRMAGPGREVMSVKIEDGLQTQARNFNDAMW